MPEVARCNEPGVAESAVAVDRTTDIASDC